MGKKNTHIVCMISDMHNMFDDRIYFKEAISLKKEGYAVFHICIGDSNQEFISKEGIYIIQFSRKTFLNNRILNKILKRLFTKDIYKQIRKAAVKIDADIFHFHDHKLIKQIRKIQKKTDAKFIFDAHDPFYQNMIDFNKGGFFKEAVYKIYSKIIQYREKKYLPYFDKIITTEENLADYYEKRIGIPIDIIYNYSSFEIQITEEKKQYDFIYCGKITEHRSVLHIIQAIHIVKTVKKDITAVFVGKISDSRLKKRIYTLIKDLNLDKNIIFIGKIPYEDVVQYYKQSKAALVVFQKIPVHYIILPIKIFEYTTMGLPMIGSNFGHVKKYIETDKSGLLVEPEKIDDIAKKMIEIIKNPKVYEQLCSNAIEAAPKYQWSIMEKKVSDIYKNLLHIE